jgi:hypothetical protein
MAIFFWCLIGEDGFVVAKWQGKNEWFWWILW